MQSRGCHPSDGGDRKQHELKHQRQCLESNKSDDRGLDPVVRFYFQLTTIHSLAAQRPAEFSNAFFQNVPQRRRAKNLRSPSTMRTSAQRIIDQPRHATKIFNSSVRFQSSLDESTVLEKSCGRHLTVAQVHYICPKKVSISKGSTILNSQSSFSKIWNSGLPFSLKSSIRNQKLKCAYFGKFEQRGGRSHRPCCCLKKDHAVKNDSWPTQLLSPLFGIVHFVSCCFEKHIKLSIGCIRTGDLLTERSQDFCKRPASDDALTNQFCGIGLY